MDLGKKLHPLEKKVLPFLEKCSSDAELVEKSGLKEVEVTRALQWLSNKGIVELTKEEEEFVSLDENGLEYAEEGLPERRFLKSLEKEEELTLKEVKGKTGLSEKEVNASIGQLKSKGLIDIEEAGDVYVSITEEGRRWLFDETSEEDFFEKDFPVSVEDLSGEEQQLLSELKNREKIVAVNSEKTTHFDITKKGGKLLEEGVDSDEYIEKVTPEVIQEKSWKDKEFREYDVTVNVPRVNYGKEHFVNEAIDYIRSIWLEMGFEEMSGDIVQTGFWNMDALFTPQDHPARDLQDTFYLENPEKGSIEDKELYKKVKQTHEDGWTTGSKGWQYEFDEEEAKRLLLRTHTTVLSAQTLAGLEKEDLPAKFFSLGRNFRNESLDKSHLFEFYQVEGIVVDPDANFRNLIGYLKEFFGKMGFPDARVRPGHFPYTEPSAEVDVYDPEKEEWIELGGAGIFRPEVTKPLLGFECPVLAWGLGMERIISDYYDIKDIRKIYENDLGELREAPKFLR